MNRPEIYGPVVHNLTFAEAARRGIICNYKVIISVVTSKELTRQQLPHGQVPVKRDRVKAAQVANQIALAQAVRRHPIRKIFTFHRTVDSAASFTAAGAEGIQTHLPQFGAFHVRGSMPSATRERVMDEFRAAPTALMSNARCLTEGIDCPAVDMVAFLTPKRSRVDIVQATGRAMHRDPANPSKMTGYIFVPLYIEQAKGESLEAAIERTEFDEVWAVLQAMQEQDDVLDDRIHYVLATGKKTKGFNDAIIRQRVEVTGPAVALGKLRRAISVKCLDRIGRRWDTMVQLLLLFKKRYGHLRVPRDAKKPWRELVRWVWLARQDKRLGTLSSTRVAELEAIGFDWHVEGQTLDDTTGLLNENQFIEASGLSRIAKYRNQELIAPVGFSVTSAGLSPFYHPRQVEELRKKLGITLDDATRLLNEKQFIEASGLTRIARYREQRLIKPVGWAITSGGLSPFYHPRQTKQLRRKLGITLTSTTGLLNEAAFANEAGFTKLADYRKRGLIKPVGWAMTSGGRLSAHYHPRQVEELRKKLGITLEDTTGLLNEKQFREASGLTRIERYREQGLIKPVGWAITHGGLSPFYHPRQIKELRRKLGITLTSTKGLLSEDAFRKKSGFTNIKDYRTHGLIKPVGWAIGSGGVSTYYHPRQIKELRRKLGITLTSTKGLLNEAAFRRKTGFTNISEYRKRGLIKPVGWAIAGPHLSAYYHLRQIKPLRRKLGITLTSTRGLLSELTFRRKSGFTQVAGYRKRGLIQPVGWAIRNAGVNPFYHPRQIRLLRRKLGVTLSSKKGLLSEDAFRKRSGFTKIDSYRKRGLIKPVGWAIGSGGVSTFYHPRQIKELRRKLGITLTGTKGLLNEKTFREKSGFTNISRYRKRGLIKPAGWVITNAGLSPCYHPRQIKELKAKLKALKRKA